ncbi:unnamed protein product, partial [Vitis vinifera]|uniref:Uncharacterized protein n=1 Tax=Vitis vinifera TaxID=29760 RepID=D7TS13_VITVI
MHLTILTNRCSHQQLKRHLICLLEIKQAKLSSKPPATKRFPERLDADRFSASLYFRFCQGPQLILNINGLSTRDSSLWT